MTTEQLEKQRKLQKMQDVFEYIYIYIIYMLKNKNEYIICYILLLLKSFGEDLQSKYKNYLKT